MKHSIVILPLITLSAFTIFASTNETETSGRHHRLLYKPTKATGGYVSKPDTGKGKILILDTQTRIPFSDYRDYFYSVEHLMRLPLEFRSGERPNGKLNAKAVRNLGADLCILVIDDAESDSVVLVSPEERWATVNVRALSFDRPDAEVLKSRVGKEVMRAFGWLCGACNSKAKNTVMGPVSSFEDLDRMSTPFYPIDHYEPTTSYLRGMGIVPKTVKTYRKACEEGWAPAPTNDVQKAIWDKVHAPPKNPMKIEFDPKKGR